jgi:hypothetical protein
MASFSRRIFHEIHTFSAISVVARIHKRVEWLQCVVICEFPPAKLIINRHYRVHPVEAEGYPDSGSQSPGDYK